MDFRMQQIHVDISQFRIINIVKIFDGVCRGFPP